MQVNLGVMAVKACEGPAGDACSWEVAPDSHLEPYELVGAVINVAITGRCVDATIVSHV